MWNKAFGFILCCFIYSNSFSKAVVHSTTAFCFFTTQSLELKKSPKQISPKALKIKEDKKWAALLLVVFVGMLGAHRLYLGTKPWVPALYLFTFGGGFLLLPIIDFFVLLFANDIQPYLDNPNFFMWIK